MEPKPAANFNRKTVLITGASTGIGAELAKLFSSARWNLILTARARGPLETIAAQCTTLDGVDATALQYDLSETGAPRALVEEINSRHLVVDALINNAGFGSIGPFHEQDAFTVLSMLQVNVTALTRLTHLILPQMLPRGLGRIMNVASTAAFQPGPFMAEYYASKAYVLSFSEALSAELAGTGITVTTLCPGSTATAFQKRAGINRSASMMSAAEVAKAGYDAMLDGRRLAIPGLKNKLLAFAVRFAPRATVLAVTRRMNEGR